MFAGVRLQFGPIDSHMPELDQARLVAQPQSLREQLRQALQMRLPKAGDRIVIGVLVRRQVPERYVFMGRTFDLPRTNHSPAVTVQQHPHHHRRVVGRHSSSILTSVDRHDLGQVQFVGYLSDEARQMFSGSQSCNDGGRRKTWFRSQVRKRLLTQPAYPTPEHFHTKMFLSALARTARLNLSPTDS